MNLASFTREQRDWMIKVLTAMVDRNEIVHVDIANSIKLKMEELQYNEPAKKRGRPFGSKNKSKGMGR